MSYSEYFSDKYASVSYHETSKTLLVTCKTSFIPEQEFKVIFGKCAELVKKSGVNKMIFDKRSLTVFHQPSMEWYHLVWKKEMMLYGLKSYRKLLPEDRIFRKSVEIGRAKILKEHPENILGQLDIRYCESLEEAEAN
jgi:hypothetical protein